MNDDTKLIWEAYDAPGGRPTNPGMGSDGNESPEASEDSRWTEEGLAELEPNELLEFISEALPKFLQTNFNPEDYDEIKSKLFSAAALLNDPYGPGGQEYDAAQAAQPADEDDRSWQDQPGVYPPGYN